MYTEMVLVCFYGTMDQTDFTVSPIDRKRHNGLKEDRFLIGGFLRLHIADFLYSTYCEFPLFVYLQGSGQALENSLGDCN